MEIRHFAVIINNVVTGVFLSETEESVLSLLSGQEAKVVDVTSLGDRMPGPGSTIGPDGEFIPAPSDYSPTDIFGRSVPTVEFDPPAIAQTDSVADGGGSEEVEQP